VDAAFRRALDFVGVPMRRQANDHQIQPGPLEHGVVIGEHGALTAGVLVGERLGVGRVAAAERDHLDLIAQRGENLRVAVGETAAAEYASA